MMYEHTSLSFPSYCKQVHSAYTCHCKDRSGSWEHQTIHQIHALKVDTDRDDQDA